MKKFASIGRTLRSSADFTLAEVVVVVGILTLAAGLVGSAVYQSLSVERTWRGDVVATKEWRHALSWFSVDATNAQTADLIDAAPPVSSVTLDWVDKDGTSHTAVYSLSGSALLRNLDGAENSVARRVVSAGFSLSGRFLILDLEVEAEQGGTESVSLQTYLRAWI